MYRNSLCYIAEPVGFEPTHPHGRRFSRPVQYQLCDGSKDATDYMVWSYSLCARI